MPVSDRIECDGHFRARKKIVCNPQRELPELPAGKPILFAGLTPLRTNGPLDEIPTTVFGSLACLPQLVNKNLCRKIDISKITVPLSIKIL
jgi:hypothetical protein